MKLRSGTCVALALSAATVLTGTAAQADLVEAASWSGIGDEYHYGKAVGWQFKANDDLLVTHLGVLDMGSAGLTESHSIGIFDSEGSLVVSTEVGAGLSGDLMLDSMVYNSVGLATLNKNETYYILADNWTQDAYTFGQDAVQYSSDISWLNFSESTSNSIFDSVLHFDGGEPGNLGPGFMYRTLPAPGALALLGLAGIAGTRRRRT